MKPWIVALVFIPLYSLVSTGQALAFEAAANSLSSGVPGGICSLLSSTDTLLAYRSVDSLEAAGQAP